MKKLFYTFLFCLLVASGVSADLVYWYNATSLTGGSTSSLDSINGQNLINNDKVIVVTASGQTYLYNLDSDSALTESSPSVIAPDSNAGDKRWILMWSGGRVIIPDSTIDQGDNSITGTLAWHIVNADGGETTVTILPGTYDVSTDITTPITMNLAFEKGALLAPSAETVEITVNSPEHIIAGKRQQIIDITSNGVDPLLFTNSGVVYPGWTGALGDGSTDDYAAINALVQAGNTIVFPYGTYNIETKLTIAVNNINLVGDKEGRQPIIQNAISGAASDAIEFTTSDPDGVSTFGSGCGISNLTITASDANMTGGAALKVTKHSGFDLRHIATLKHPFGIDLYGVLNSNFTDFYLYHTGSTTVNSSALLRVSGQLNDDASYTVPWTTTFSDFHIGCADTVDYGILIRNADGLMFSNAYVAGAHEDLLRIQPNVATYTAVACFWNNIYFDPTAYSDNAVVINSTTANVGNQKFSNCTFGAADVAGISISGGNTTDVLISNCKFSDIDAGAIAVNDVSSKVIINGNSFKNCRTDGDDGAFITLTNGNITTITGNIFWNTAAEDAYGIIVTGTHNQVSITGNSFENFNQIGIGYNAPTIADGVKQIGNTTDAALKIPDIGYVEQIAQLADEATPSVIANGIRYNTFLTGGTTTITDFDDGVTGQVITIIAEHSLTITEGTNIFLSGSINFPMTATDTLTLICKADNKWYEVSRSDSGA